MSDVSKLGQWRVPEIGVANVRIAELEARLATVEAALDTGLACLVTIEGLVSAWNACRGAVLNEIKEAMPIMRAALAPSEPVTDAYKLDAKP